MFTLRRSHDRAQSHRGTRHGWNTFIEEDAAGTPAHPFGVLENLDEERLPARCASQRQRYLDGDVVTYVREGAVAFVNSIGQAGVVHAGEFQRVTAAGRVEHRETNASHIDSTHVFQIALRGQAVDCEPSNEQMRFSVAERRGRLRVVASPDARGDSLRIHQDALVFSAILHAGQHLAHELKADRSAWVHVVEGDVSIMGNLLTAGDGAGVSAEYAVSVTARSDGEILLLDLGPYEPGPGARTGRRKT